MEKARTQVDSCAVREVEVERLASGDGERVNVHGCARDRIVNVVERRDGARAVGRSGRRHDEWHEGKEGGEAEEGRHCCDTRVSTRI